MRACSSPTNNSRGVSRQQATNPSRGLRASRRWARCTSSTSCTACRSRTPASRSRWKSSSSPGASEARMAKLETYARVIRSKNATPFYLTLDLFFENAENYNKVKDSKALNKEAIAELYKVPLDYVKNIFF